MSSAIEFALAVLLAAGAVWFTLQPILRPSPADAGRDDGDDEEEDVSPRAVALRALKEIEFDRATGKLSDADYDALKRKYTGLALEALRDAGSGMREATGSRQVAHPASPIPHLACPTHGPRPEPGAEFCSECGCRLGGGGGAPPATALAAAPSSRWRPGTATRAGHGSPREPTRDPPTSTGTPRQS